MINNKIIKNIIGIFIVIAIFYFLGKSLFLNWDKIKIYEFEFNYFYLIASLLLCSLNIFYVGLIWNKILTVFDKDNKLSNIDAINITVYSNFGKYVPGKLWGIVGAVYLGARKKVSKKALGVSYTLQTIIGVMSAIVISIVFIFFSKIEGLSEIFNYLIFFTIPIFILVFYPNIFIKFFNIILKIIKKEPVDENLFPNRKDFIKYFIYMSTTRLINGTAFFLFIKSIVSISFFNILPIAGIYILSNVSGFLAIFTPGGLGVKEGVLTGLLTFYFPLGVAALISILARIWLTISDLLALSLVKIYSATKPN